MKSLSNYIEEKLIINQQVDEKLLINKKFKNIDDYRHIEPKNKGKCLLLFFSKKTNDQSHRITLSTETYEYDSNFEDVNIFGYDDFPFIKNKKEYYWRNSSSSGWINLLLFDDDAKLFLNTLLNNNTLEFDKTYFEEMFDSVEIGFNWPYKVMKCEPQFLEYYNEKDINNILNELDEIVK